jgi:hypothetical protein
MFEKYLKYKIKYLNLKNSFDLIGGNIEIAKALEIYLDKIFYHAVANYQIRYPTEKLVITGRKVNMIYEPTNYIPLRDDEPLYELLTTNTDINFVLIKLVGFLNSIHNSFNKFNPIAIKMMNQILKKLESKYDYINSNHIFKINETNIILNIISKSEDFNFIVNICTIEFKTEIDIKQIISYPLRKLTTHYTERIEIYYIKLDISNLDISNLDSILNKNLIINRKKKLLENPEELDENIDEIDIIYENWLREINIPELLLLTNTSQYEPPNTYTYVKSSLYFFNHNYLLFNKFQIYKSDHTVYIYTEKLLQDESIKKFETIIITEMIEENSFKQFIELIPIRYTLDSYSINTLLINNINDWENSIDFPPFENLNVQIYIFIFIYLLYTINKPLLTTLNNFKVYSVSQSLYNFNDINSRFTKNQIYTFPIFKSTTLAISYKGHPKFIGSDLIPLVFEIEIKPNELNGSEFMFIDNSQYEFVLTIGSQVEIVDVSTCYTTFYTGISEPLNQICILLKCKLLKSNYIPSLEDFESILTFMKENKYKLIGGNPNMQSIHKSILKQKLTTEQELTTEQKLITEKNLTFIQYIEQTKQNISKNPFILEHIDNHPSNSNT